MASSRKRSDVIASRAAAKVQLPSPFAMKKQAGISVARLAFGRTLRRDSDHKDADEKCPTTKSMQTKEKAHPIARMDLSPAAARKRAAATRELGGA